MTTSTLEWNWRGANIRLDIASSGTGPALLLLPALSSISTHHEMGPLAEHLAPRYSTVCVDWPGFGARARPQVDWTPDAYSAFLAFLLTSVVPHPHAVIAAGHAASYALKYAASAPPATTRLVLIAPTWRGPLPTVLGDAGRFSTGSAAWSISQALVRSSIVSTSTSSSCAAWAPVTSTPIRRS